MRKFGWAALFLVLAAVLAVGGFLAVDRLAGDPQEGAAVQKPELGSAPVVRTDLRRVETFPAVLRNTDPRTAMTGMGGTVTSMPEEGVELGRGDVLFEIDGRPVFLFYGERPMWRPLAPGPDGSRPEGPDVEQLESNLAALGYPASPPDEVFDEDTVRQIRGWRAGAGLDAAGSVEQGRIVYVEDRIRVGGRLAAPGALVSPGAPVLEVSGTGQEVYLELPADRRDLIEAGDRVAVKLPDGVSAPGAVHTIGVVGSGPGEGRDGGGFAAVAVRLDDPGLGAKFGGYPVDVEIVTGEAVGVLAVPVKALLGLSEGGYAVERRRGGAVTLVAVETGMYAGGLVEVEGDLAAGDLVVVPE